jgi:hypothetical protein
MSRIASLTDCQTLLAPEKEERMRKLFVVGLTLFAFGAANATAANPSGTGQPSQTCLSSTAATEPGNAANAPGSAFNENGGIAGGVYAGNGQTLSTPANGHAVSQYDVACFQVSQHH